MRSARDRRRKFFEKHPNCCFCGGRTPATTEDHQPARIIFDDRHWPEGYSFPACEKCNAASRAQEHVFALLSRFGPAAEQTARQREECRNLIGTISDNFPGYIKLLTANEKRAFFKQEGIPRPKGVALSDLPMVGIEADQTENIMRMVLTKLFCALHYKHSETIVPATGRIFTRWITNAYGHKANLVEEFGRMMKMRPQLMQASKILNDQFDYSYSFASDNSFSGFFCAFRDSFAGYGLVFCDANLASDIEEADLSRPFGWE